MGNELEMWLSYLPALWFHQRYDYKVTIPNIGVVCVERYEPHYFIIFSKSKNTQTGKEIRFKMYICLLLINHLKFRSC